MLYAHDRQHRGRPIDPVSTEALRTSFFTEERSTGLLFRARALLKDLHRSRLWLACDCAGTDDESPMIGPREGKGGIHPFRFGAVAHAETCPFAASIRTLSTTDEFDENSEPLHGAWNLSVLTSPLLSREDRAIGLHRLLRTALVQLGYNRVHASAFQPRRRGEAQMLDQPYARLKHLGAQDMGNGLTFGQVGNTFLPGIVRTYNSLRAIAAQPGHEWVKGIYIGLTEEAVSPQSGADGYLRVKDVGGESRVFPVLGDIHLPPGDSGMRGPYWTVSIIDRVSDKEPFRMMEAAAMPASDRRTLVPLPTGEYRELVHLVLEQLQFWRSWKKLELEAELEIPLFPFNGWGEHSVVIVLPNGRRFVITRSDSSAADMSIDQDAAMDDGMRRRLTAAVAAGAGK